MRILQYLLKKDMRNKKYNYTHIQGGTMSKLLEPKLSDSKKGSDFQDDFFA